MTSSRFDPITLSVPPSANAYWRDRVANDPRKKAFVQRYQTKEAVDYKKMVKTLSYAAGWRPVQKPSEVSLRIVWHRTQRRGDLDNRLKVLLDALQGTAYVDDSQVAAIEAVRITEKTRDDCVEVAVNVLGTEEQLEI